MQLSILKKTVNNLVNLEKLCFPKEPLSRRSLRYYLRRGTVVLRDYGYLILSYTKLKARVYSIGIIPKEQGKGLGRELLSLAITIARLKGKKAISLEVREDNATAIALYTSLEFKPIKTLENYYDDGAPAIKMRKELNGY